MHSTQAGRCSCLHVPPLSSLSSDVPQPTTALVIATLLTKDIYVGLQAAASKQLRDHISMGRSASIRYNAGGIGATQQLPSLV